MKLTPHYQQQMKQTTSHFFNIHLAVKNPLCHCNARTSRASCLHISSLADWYRGVSVSADSYKRRKKGNLLARTGKRASTR